MFKRDSIFNSLQKDGLHNYFIDLTKVFLTDKEFFENNIKSFDINDINDVDCRHFMAIARDAYLKDGLVYGIPEVRESLIMYGNAKDYEIDELDAINERIIEPDRVEYVKSEFRHLHLFTKMAILMNNIRDSFLDDGVTKENIGNVYQRLEDDFLGVRDAYSQWQGKTNEWDA